jgi:DNA-binding XRE family transcriptional regulator
MFGFSSGCYLVFMKPQYSSRLRRIRPKVRNEIRRYRLQLGITQRELARQVGVRLSTFSSWERGLTCPSVPMVLKLAKLLSTLAEGLYPEFYLGQKEKQVAAGPA